MSRKDRAIPAKRTINLYFKPGRTTKSTAAALYILVTLAVVLGLSKVLVYDLWGEVESARVLLSQAEDRLDAVMAQLSDYNEVKERYQRYSATDEERELIDRMEVLELLDQAVGATARLNSAAISGKTVQVQFYQVTLGQAAEIVQRLEQSPLVDDITVNTAVTSQREEDLVSASILIQLQKEVEGQ